MGKATAKFRVRPSFREHEIDSFFEQSIMGKLRSIMNHYGRNSNELAHGATYEFLGCEKLRPKVCLRSI